MADFGSVQNVDLSEVWPHELDFSRWLAENIDPKSVRQKGCSLLLVNMLFRSRCRN